MEKSNVNLENLLSQLSEDKINLVVDNDSLRAGAAKTITDNSGGGWTITGPGASLSWD